MKKTLVSALTTALVVGAASTTFAAANPFSDVPADHWAYDAVAQLAADGVIDGYGDTTFQGQKNITRYEMAQMVAKAMAKAPQGTDKALVDRLAAEFADELGNLGVRVANLERNADKVKWNGTAEYTWQSIRMENASRTHYDNVLFRLEPSAEVNSHWHVNARLDANSNLKSDEGDNGNVELKRIWAEGNYGKFTAKVGKFAPIDDDSIADTTFSGVEASYGDNFKVTVGAGRISYKGSLLTSNFDYTSLNVFDTKTDNSASNYQYIGLDYAANKFNIGAHWHNLKSDAFVTSADYDFTTSSLTLTSEENVNIWKVNAGYKFNKSVNVAAWYAKNNKSEIFNNAWNAEVNYKGAEAENKGTWGAWLAYRKLGPTAIISSTYDVIRPMTKGWELGANYTLFKNVVLTGRYGWAKTLDDSATKVNTVFGRVNFFF